MVMLKVPDIQPMESAGMQHRIEHENVVYRDHSL